MGIDPLICRCKTLMVIVAFISDVEVVQRILDHLKIPMNPVPLPLEHGPIQTRLRGLDPTQLAPHLDLEVAPATSSTDNDTSDCGARDPPV